jgi:hypothetical protein
MEMEMKNDFMSRLHIDSEDDDMGSAMFPRVIVIDSDMDSGIALERKKNVMTVDFSTDSLSFANSPEDVREIQRHKNEIVQWLKSSGFEVDDATNA